MVNCNIIHTVKMANLNTKTTWDLNDSRYLQSKYKKCLNITEEIYKRIHLTFEIKKSSESNNVDKDLSDQINSDELSEGTDLFAFDDSGSLSSSSEAKQAVMNCDTFNNNIEIKFKKAQPICRRPKKRFRKRVKKSELKKQQFEESDMSSDESVLKSRITDLNTKCVDSPKDNQKDSLEDVMGIPRIIIVSKDSKSCYIKKTNEESNAALKK